MTPLEVVVLLAALQRPPDCEPAWVARQRFPNQETCQWAIQVNLQFAAEARNRLDASLSSWERSRWQSLLDDAAERRRAWNMITGEPSNHEVLRYWLDLTHQQIGTEAYMAGQMPSPVPLWSER